MLRGQQRYRSEWLGKIQEAGVRRRAEFYYQQLERSSTIRRQQGPGSSPPHGAARYSGEISIEQIRADFSRRNGPKIVVSENKENEAVA
jgi:hypothetical protein